MDKDKKDSDLDDDICGIFPDEPETPVRKYKQQYRKAWEMEPDFKGWLTSVPNKPNKAYCKACKRDLHAHRLTLVKHTISIKHMKAAVEYFDSKTLEESKKKEKQSKNENSKRLVDATTGAKEDIPVRPVDEIVPNKNDGAQMSEQPLRGDSILSSISPHFLIPHSGNNITGVNEELEDDPGRSQTTTSSLPQEPARSLVLARPDKPPISTHVLDTTRGLPVSGIQVSLYQLIDGRWTLLNDSCTNLDGRCADLIDRESVKPGRYRLHFDTHQYFELRGLDCLFPFIEYEHGCRLLVGQCQCRLQTSLWYSPPPHLKYHLRCFDD
ncbi:uncharacterized protein LOC111063252 isoform X2 [Nilaparvata lugens]|uniref:uncharacterized protein LOC111063252 isoform X2 n=1 Tax=Nilaparvata lugens TaxID=108931 RepID=UPI00193CCF43|nr:uncharacterized protein LOC111063252 isoform X2 [Nilaparvata lugens]